MANWIAQRNLVEALLFSSPTPVRQESLILRGVDEDNIPSIMTDIREFYRDRALSLYELRDGWVLGLAEEWSADEGKAHYTPSKAAMETLSLIAIHQPITVAEIETMRGVKLSRPLMAQLLGAGLVEAKQRRSGSGRAVTYQTTQLFLEKLGIQSLRDLPTPEEIIMMDE